MELKDLLKDLEVETFNLKNVEITDITDDSRKVIKGSLFVALKGNNYNGNLFIKDAIKQGALAVLTEENPKENLDVPIIISKDINNDTKKIAKKFYDNPFNKIKTIGVTGTNGKTTTTYLIKSILDLNYKTGLIGTIKTIINNKEFESINTTPNTLTLIKLFKNMVDEKVDYAVMEVSSHGLKLNRIDGITFESVIFTNLTQDHLDFHKNMEDYRNSKLILFSLVKENGSSIINLDDPNSKYFVESSKAKNVFTFGIKNRDARFQIKIEKISLDGSIFTIVDKQENKNYQIKTKLIGEPNIYNCASAFLTCYSLKIPVEKIKDGLEKANPVKGRYEIYYDRRGFKIIIDYAHSPDSLERLIKTVRRLTPGKIITVFGCGGDRDKEKRPIMGKIASHLSDIVVLTSDNPRNEDPNRIIDDIIEGIIEKNYIVEVNRKNAIKLAFSHASENDSIIIAGKGHEDYQIIKNKKYHFDDSEIVKSFMKS
ncbi:MAG: UDP-N-acetylmuramoyl-L-alanyl-D-glutamate--2,6-diaminopimelate ligase [candidate division WOR-3 bacterium]